MKISNELKGSIVVGMSVLYVLIALSVGFVLYNVNEMNEARRHYHSTKAFWLAEAGINMFMHNPSMLDDAASKTIDYGGGIIYLTKDDSRPTFCLITATGVLGGSHRKVQISYPVRMPEAYLNALSSQGNLVITGNKVSIVANGKTRLSGYVQNNAGQSSLFFSDLNEHVDSSLTTLSYPTSQEGEGQGGAFIDFVQNNQDLLSKYPKEQVLYLKSVDTYTLPSDGSLNSKKIIYIEGLQGEGNVIINSSQFLAKDQNVTVIATGVVTFNQSGTHPPNSQLNIISWEGYNETVSAPSTHRGLVYTHGNATFNSIRATSIHTGGIIAGGNIEFNDVWIPKIFNYADMSTGGAHPPGFEKLFGASISGIATHPSSWKEIIN